MPDMKKSIVILIAVLTMGSAGTLAAQQTILAATPPMGWNSWNKFACKVNEGVVRQAADAMVSSGMKDAGFQYIVIDDCWQTSRDKDGNIVVDSQNFPSGIKALADYVHTKGLKFGIYSDAGTKTCQGRPGGRGYEFQDARQYAAWGVDYLKYDWCNTGTQDAPASYGLMRQALDASGRPIVFSLCEWGKNKPWLWGNGIGNLWRTTGDIQDRWGGSEKWPDGSCCSNGVLAIVDQQVGLESFAGPGHWNDPDMLEVGNGGMTITEYRSHFSLWAILAAPLIAGNDLGNMTPEIHDILTNKDVISVDQDPLGREGRRVRKDGDLEIWAKEMAGGNRAAVLFNRGATEQQIILNWEDLGYPSHIPAAVRDLWQHKELGQFTGRFSATVRSHGVVMVTVKP
jgi:alpha-galactosidase